MRRLAIRCLLSDKARENRLTLLQALDLPAVRTKEMMGILSALDVTSSALLVTPEADRNVVLSARNLAQVKTLPANNLNVVDLLNNDWLIMTVEAVRRAEELWAGGATPGDVLIPEKPKARRRTTRRRSPRKKDADDTSAPQDEGETQAQPSDEAPEGGQEA